MIRAVLFGPNLPPAGRPVTIRADAAGLAVTSDGAARVVPYAGVAARRGGWNADGVLLAWHDAAGAWTLHVDGAGLAALRAAAPADWSHGLPRARRVPAAAPMLAVVAVLFAAGLGVLAAVWRWSDPLVDLAVARIPIAWEEQLGAVGAAGLQASAPTIAKGPARDAVATIGARLAAQAESPYAFNFVLIDSPEVNALAAPGGWIVVYAGLLRRAASAEELAGVLAHEVAHVVQRHSLRGLVRQLGWRAMLGIVLWGTGDLGGVIGSWAAELETLRFSRAQESDADHAAVALLVRAGIDPRGLPSFFEQLAAAEPAAPALLATHPASAERARLAREVIGDGHAFPPLAIDWSAVQQALATGGGS